MRVDRRELFTGRAVLVVLMIATVLPFISIFTTALYPSGTLPSGPYVFAFSAINTFLHLPDVESQLMTLNALRMARSGGR